MFELIFVKGGWVMVPIVALSIYALAIIFFKIYQFSRGGLFNLRFMDSAMGHIKQGELSQAGQVLAKEKGPVARIMRVSIECLMNRDMSMKSRESEIARVGSSELRYLESYLRGLEMTYTIAPLMGLMGTVIGMINAFTRLSESGSRVDPSMLAGGIWEALINTAGGLAVAVPALAAYYIFDSIIERVRATMRDVTVQVLALEDAFKRNEKEQERRVRMEEEKAQRNLFEQYEQQHHVPAPQPVAATEPVAVAAVEAVTSPVEQVVVAPAPVPQAPPAPAPAAKAAAPASRQAAPAPAPAPARPATARRVRMAAAPQQAIAELPAQAAEASEELSAEKITGARSAPQSTSTLHLLSPTYNKF
jgi:biopolymer transport protein ExbB